jgi:hypothetical protein
VRVEWTLLSGDDAEMLLAMLLCSQMPNAMHLKPGQGDGGIDIFDPAPEELNVERDVYQVKRFTGTLTGSHKRQIQRSFARVQATSATDGWRITAWNLVLPMDPTPDNLQWFSGLTAEAEFPCQWIGLTQCNMLAATYPTMVDYWIHDGRQRLGGAMEAMTAALAGRLRRQTGQPLEAGDVVGDIGAIHQAVNNSDPFCRYEFTTADRPPSGDDPSEPGLVAVIPAVMIYGDDVTHVVTEEGVAYLYKAHSLADRRDALSAIAGVTPVGLGAQARRIEQLRHDGLVAYPEDLGIDVRQANRSLLAARSIQDLVAWSGGLGQRAGQEVGLLLVVTFERDTITRSQHPLQGLA